MRDVSGLSILVSWHSQASKYALSALLISTNFQCPSLLSARLKVESHKPTKQIQHLNLFRFPILGSCLALSLTLNFGQNVQMCELPLTAQGMAVNF